MTSAIDGEPGWHIDPATLLPVLDDEAAFRAANATDPALEVLVALWSGDPDHAAALLKPLIDADPTAWRQQAFAADVTRDRGDTSAAIKILKEPGEGQKAAGTGSNPDMLHVQTIRPDGKPPC